jgi:large subunit ribosomal protein L3
MTSVFTPGGDYVPVTVLEMGPCVVTQVKTKTKDGYDALQLGFGEAKTTRTNKPLAGHLKKSGIETARILREFATENPDEYETGQTLSIMDLFTVGDSVDVVGTMKGRGFSGVIKRHGFRRGRKTHGSHSIRIPGSIGCSAYPARVIKGKKMPGRYGTTRKTVRNLEIVDIRADQNILMVKGAVPGWKTGWVEVLKPKFKK